MKKTKEPIDKFLHERAWQAQGKIVIAGVDEAGRGPLAGPVVVAGVILPLDGSFDVPVDDSKALTAVQRDRLYDLLTKDSRIRYCIAYRSAQDIDRLNILKATHEGMREVVLGLGKDVEVALVDGLKVPDFPIEAEFIVKGDARSASIAAASILAKVTRDRLMEDLDRQYPGYGFAKHKGYGTAEHLRALTELGACPEHRCTFGPVRAAIEKKEKQLTFEF